jgi:pyrroline-5-carboxylate reductase
MGSAMLAGWLEAGLEVSYVVEPNSQTGPHTGASGVTMVDGVEAISADFQPSAVIFAVKPQNADATLPVYQRFVGHSVFLSIMAGRTIGGMRRLLGAHAEIVRAMPNTPAAVRQGVSVAVPGPSVTAAQIGLCDQLLAAIGTVAWVGDEALIDPVTAISGGGPAYVFLLAELLEKAGIAHGLTPDLARALARQTVIGSGALLAASREESDALRRAVTSPGGTTERALNVLMADAAWPALMAQAIAHATARSRELAD